jgi:hypothetical protein
MQHHDHLGASPQPLWCPHHVPRGAFAGWLWCPHLNRLGTPTMFLVVPLQVGFGAPHLNRLGAPTMFLVVPLQVGFGAPTSTVWVP